MSVNQPAAATSARSAPTIDVATPEIAQATQTSRVGLAASAPAQDHARGIFGPVSRTETAPPLDQNPPEQIAPESEAADLELSMSAEAESAPQSLDLGGRETAAGSTQAGAGSATRGGSAKASSSGSGVARGPSFFIVRKSTGSRAGRREKTDAQQRIKARPGLAGQIGKTEKTDQPQEAPAAISVPAKESSVRENIIEARTGEPRLSSSHLKLQYIRDVQDLAQKIQARAKLQGVNGMTALELQLSPARLGSVRLQVEVQDNEMILHFSAQNQAAVPVLQEMRSELAQIISELGYNLSRCDVEYQGFSEGGQNAQATYSAGKHHQAMHRETGPAEQDEDLPGDFDNERFHALDLGYNTLDLVA